MPGHVTDSRVEATLDEGRGAHFLDEPGQVLLCPHDFRTYEREVPVTREVRSRDVVQEVGDAGKSSLRAAGELVSDPCPLVVDGLDDALPRLA